MKRLFSSLCGILRPAAALLSFAAFFSPFFAPRAIGVENGLLFVYPEPAEAEVRVLEIDEVYYPGISLPPGAYQVRVSKFGYMDAKKKIHVEPEETFDLFVELKKASRLKDPETGMEFVWIPGGCFEMGCGPWTEEDCLPDEVPSREVCVEGFWMGKYEVTQEVWEKVMGENPSRFPKGPDYPVEQVSWNEAREFAERLKINGIYPVRLPDEAEWEYAARDGGKNQVYAGGGDVSLFGWHKNNSAGATHPVGKKKANHYGLYDMSGNVWEWCRDAYFDDAYQKKTQNPIADAQVVFRVRRGGSWNCESQNLRCLFRGRYPPELKFDSNGVRLVLDEFE